VQLTAKQLLAKKQLPERSLFNLIIRAASALLNQFGGCRSKKNAQTISPTTPQSHPSSAAGSSQARRPHTLRLMPSCRHQLSSCSNATAAGVCVCVYVNVCVTCVCVCEVWKAVALNPVCLAETFSRWQQPGAVAPRNSINNNNNNSQLCPSLLILFV